MQFTAIGHWLAAIGILTSGLPSPLQLLLLIVLINHYALAHYRWLHQPTLQILHHRQGDWFLSMATSEKPWGKLSKCSYWHSWLVIVQVEMQEQVQAVTPSKRQQTRYLPLFADSCTQSGFKRLQLIATTRLSASPKSRSPVI